MSLSSGAFFILSLFSPPPSILNQGEASRRFHGESARHTPPDLDLLAGGCLVPKWLVATVIFTRGVLQKGAITPHLRFPMALSFRRSDRSSFLFSPYFPPTSTCDTDAINHTCRLFNKYANFDQLNGVTAFVPLINNERLCLIALVFMYKLFKLANNNAGRARRI